VPTYIIINRRGVLLLVDVFLCFKTCLRVCFKHAFFFQAFQYVLFKHAFAGLGVYFPDVAAPANLNCGAFEVPT
jgi:hypothetical protein